MHQLTKKEIKMTRKMLFKQEKDIVLLMENIQYARNVASIFRIADAAGVKKVILTGISKTPPFGKEMRQVSRDKENSTPWEYSEASHKPLEKLKKDGYKIVAIELTNNSITLADLRPALKDQEKICLVAGSEVFGVKETTLNECDMAVTIPMYGKGASLNVTVSVGIALYSI